MDFSWTARHDLPPMHASAALLAAVAGLTFGLSLIVAIGAQNAFVLRQGLLREHRGVVVAVCATSDVVLILLGVGGAGALLAAAPALADAARIAGAAFLLAYALFAARRAWRGGSAAVDEEGERAMRGPLAILLTTLALTWLNPHVYLDTVVLAGTAADAHGDQRWWFAAGMACGSVIWFSALGYGSATLRPLFAQPAAWRVLDGVIAAIMLALGLSLLLGAV